MPATRPRRMTRDAATVGEAASQVESLTVRKGRSQSG